MTLEFLSAFSLSEVLRGIVGNRSDSLFYQKWLILKNNLSTLTPDATHDLQRAVNRAYLQATLQVCAIRGEQLGIDVDAWLRRETLLSVLQKAAEWLRPEPVTTIVFESDQRSPSLPQRLRDWWQQGRLEEGIATLKSSAEIKWLDQAQSALWQQLDKVEDGNFENPIVSDDALESLLRPKGRRASEMQEELRRSLLARVIKELRKSYGRHSVEFFLLVKSHWFDFFCANFQFALKSDERVFRVFMAKSQANKSAGLFDGIEIEGKPLTHDRVRAQFEEFGGELSQRIERCADELRGQQQAGFDEISGNVSRLLPIVALIEDLHRIIEQLPELLHATAEDIKKHTSQATEASAGKVISHFDPQFTDVRQRLDEIKDNVGGAVPPFRGRLTINLPPRNLIFTGRIEVLDELQAELERSGRAALSGLPGVGKTQTALEYAHKHYEMHDYDYVIFARAATETELLTDLARAAQALNLPSKDQADFNLVAAAVRAWLESAERWLLIFDNADDLTVIQRHMPANVKGQILLTRRPDDAGGFAPTIKIKTMEVDEGGRLLLLRAGFVKPSDPPETAAPENTKRAQAIAREVDGLPLSLNIAGAFIKETRTSLIEYLEIYRAQGRELRRERDPNAFYEHSVATVFALAFKQIATPDDDKEESAIIARAAIDLLRLCAFLASDGIPLELIVQASSALSEDLFRVVPWKNEVWWKKTVAKATRFSLLEARRLMVTFVTEEVSGGTHFFLMNPKPQGWTYDMHREVQAVMRDEMGEAQRPWLEKIVLALSAVFGDRDTDEWSKCNLLIPHAQECLKHGDRLIIETQDIIALKYQTGSHLVTSSRYVEAGPLFEQTLELTKKLFSLEHPYVATFMNELAKLYQVQGRYAEAEPLFVQALELREKTFGLEHAAVLESLNNLATLYHLQGRYAEAEPLYVRSRGLFEKLFATEEAGIAININNLASLYQDQGRYAEAEPLLVQALELREKLFGPEHPSVAESLNNLGLLYQNQGRNAEAEPLLVRALKLKMKLLPPEHPHVAAGMNSLAVSYQTQGRYVEAEHLYVQALRLRAKLFGPEHPDIAANMYNLATLYQTQGRYAEANPLFERALAMFEKLLGVDHPHTIMVQRVVESIQKEKPHESLGRRQIG